MITIYRLTGGKETAVCRIAGDHAAHTCELMGRDEVKIDLTSDSPLPLQVLDYIRLDGTVYTLNREPEFTKASDAEFRYGMTFESPRYNLLEKRYVHPLTGESRFAVNGTLRDLAQMVVDNANRIDPGWTLGDVPETVRRNLLFEGVTCNDALSKLAEAFSVEFHVGGRTLAFCDRYETPTPLVFEQGMGRGLYTVSQQSVDSENTVTRAVLYGGAKNLPQGYRGGAEYLRWTDAEGHPHVENFDEYPKIVERDVYFDDIYPHFDGTVGSTRGENGRIVRSDAIDFDLNGQLIGGLKAKINFLSGDLEGNAFEIESYDHPKREVALIPKEDETALPGADGKRPTIPSAQRQARHGDRFDFLDITMPQAYVDRAEEQLHAKGLEWLAANSSLRVKFSLEIDHRFLRRKNWKIAVGQIVLIRIPEKQAERRLRIVSVERNLHSGMLRCEVSNYQRYSWEKDIEARLQSAGQKVEIAKSEILYDLQATKEWTGRNFARLTGGNLLLGAQRVEQGGVSADGDVLSGGNVAAAGTLSSGGDASVGGSLSAETDLRAGADVSALRDLAAGRNVEAAGDVLVGGARLSAPEAGAATPALRVSGPQPGDDAEVRAWGVRADRVTASDRVTSERFVSGLTGEGAGFRQDPATGKWIIEGDSLRLRETLSVPELVLDKIRAVKGSLIVSCGGGKVASAECGPEQWTLTLEDARNPFVAGDLVRCQTFGAGGTKHYWVPVASVGDGALCIDRSAFADGDTPAAGDEIVQLGHVSDAARQSAIYISATDSGAPVIDVLEGIAGPSLAGRMKVRLGNLSGITDTTLNPSGYGLYALNCFLSGSFRLSSGETLQQYVDRQGDALRSELVTELTASDGEIMLGVRSEVHHAIGDVGDTANGAAADAAAARTAAETAAAAASAAQSTANAAQTNAGAANSAASAAQSTANQAKSDAAAAQLAAFRKSVGQSWSGGEMLYPDPAFAAGTNSTFVYDNAKSGKTTWERVARPAGAPVTGSDYVMRYANTGPGPAPGLGGFTFFMPGNTNTGYVCRFVAKLPEGYTLEFTSNPTGTGAEGFWCTEQISTGQWQEYIYYLRFGTGTIGPTFYFFVKGTAGSAAAPVEMLVGWASCFNVDSQTTSFRQAADAAAAASAAQGAADTAKADAATAAAAADAAKTAAATAQGTAAAAKTDAASANAKLSDWASDSKISPTEKTALRQQKAAVDAEYADCGRQTDRYALKSSAEWTAYASAYAAASAAFAKYTAAAPESIATGSDFANIAACYPKRQALLDRIAAAAKAASDTAAAAASAAQSTANAAQTNAGAAKTAADQAAAAASAAQGTANNAQSTANQAKTDAAAVRTDMVSELAVRDGLIAAKVAKTDFDALGRRVASAESSITQQSGLISSKVSQTDYNANNTAVSGRISQVEQTAGSWGVKITDTVNGAINGVKTGLGELGIRLDGADKGLHVRADKFDIVSTDGTQRIMNATADGNRVEMKNVDITTGAKIGIVEIAKDSVFIPSTTGNSMQKIVLSNEEFRNLDMTLETSGWVTVPIAEAYLAGEASLTESTKVFGNFVVDKDRPLTVTVSGYINMFSVSIGNAANIALYVSKYESGQYKEPDFYFYSSYAQRSERVYFSRTAILSEKGTYSLVMKVFHKSNQITLEQPSAKGEYSIKTLELHPGGIFNALSASQYFFAGYESSSGQFQLRMNNGNGGIDVASTGVTLKGTASHAGASSFTGAATFNSTASFKNTASFSSSATFNGAASFTSTTAFGGAATFNGALKLGGTAAINGFALSARKITGSGVTLSRDDSYVFYEGTANITLYLPSGSYPGKVYMIRKMHDGNINVQCSSSAHKIYANWGTGPSFQIAYSRLCFFVYDGTNRWIANGMEF